MELKTILLGQRPERVWTGGSGEAIVLLHGAWAGAEAYWSTVTDDLERTHLVVAPELPLLHSPEGLPNFGAYVAWLARRTCPRQERCAQDAASPGAVDTRDDPGSRPPAADRAPGRIPPGAAQVPEAVGWRRGPVIHLTDMLF